MTQKQLERIHKLKNEIKELKKEITWIKNWQTTWS